MVGRGQHGDRHTRSFPAVSGMGTGDRTPLSRAGLNCPSGDCRGLPADCQTIGGGPRGSLARSTPKEAGRTGPGRGSPATTGRGTVPAAAGDRALRRASTKAQTKHAASGQGRISPPTCQVQDPCRAGASPPRSSQASSAVPATWRCSPAGQARHQGLRWAGSETPGRTWCHRAVMRRATWISKHNCPSRRHHFDRRIIRPHRTVGSRARNRRRGEPLRRVSSLSESRRVGDQRAGHPLPSRPVERRRRRFPHPARRQRRWASSSYSRHVPQRQPAAIPGWYGPPDRPPPAGPVP